MWTGYRREFISPDLIWNGKEVKKEETVLFFVCFFVWYFFSWVENMTCISNKPLLCWISSDPVSCLCSSRNSINPGRNGLADTSHMVVSDLWSFSPSITPSIQGKTVGQNYFHLPLSVLFEICAGLNWNAVNQKQPHRDLIQPHLPETKEGYLLIWNWI